MWVRVRLPAIVAAVAMITTISGCSQLKSAASTHSAPPSAPASIAPSDVAPSGPPAAAAAGGACLLLDFNVINAALGSTFSVAAAATSSATYTCDVQTMDAGYPDLTLTVTATDLLPLDFTATVAPAGSTSVPKLGKIGYALEIAATTKLGPAIEIGWLSGNDRLILMRYTFPKSATAAAATALKSKMITLAQAVDGTTV